MVLKVYNPVTPSMRQLVRVDKAHLWKGGGYKPLVRGLSETGGRNNLGRITVWHKGGRHKRLYRIIDFKRCSCGRGTVERLEYDPNRTAFIALIKYEDNKYSYILAPQGLKIGDVVSSGDDADIKVGNCLTLRAIPIGSILHNVEMKPGKGGQLARSAGTSIQLVGKNVGYAQIKFKTGELRLIPLNCRATIGVVSNADHKNTNYGKAGAKRRKGIRPTVRGVAMNPVDHPHGGGEGKTSGGRHPVTPWGKPTKGKKTRKNKFTSKYIIKKRGK